MEVEFKCNRESYQDDLREGRLKNITTPEKSTLYNFGRSTFESA